MNILRLASIFNSLLNSNLSSKTAHRTKTNRNPHNFTRYEVAPKFHISAINIESATAQYNKIMAHKAMRLEKSNRKQLAA